MEQPDGKNVVNIIKAHTYSDLDRILCTQSPQPNALPEFLTQVYEGKIKTIVVLNQFELKDRPRYWPSESEDDYEQHRMIWPPFVVARKKIVQGKRKSKFGTSTKIEISIQGLHCIFGDWCGMVRLQK